MFRQLYAYTYSYYILLIKNILITQEFSIFPPAAWLGLSRLCVGSFHMYLKLSTHTVTLTHHVLCSLVQSSFIMKVITTFIFTIFSQINKYICYYIRAPKIVIILLKDNFFIYLSFLIFYDRLWMQPRFGCHLLYSVILLMLLDKKCFVLANSGQFMNKISDFY